MSKPFTYWVRLAMVATMCTLVTFSPVSAGRWMDRLLHRDACKTTSINCCEPVVSFETSCLIVPSAPCVITNQSVYEHSSILGCDSMPTESYVTGGAPVVEPFNSSMPPMVPSVVESFPAPIERPSYVEQPKQIVMPTPTVDSVPAVESPMVFTPKVESPAQKPVPPIVGKTSTAELVPVVTEPKPVLETIQSGISGLNPFAPVTNPPEVKPTGPIEDLFGSEPKPTKQVEPAPIDDLFGTDPKPTAPATAAPIDDLFGTDPKPTAPATAAPIDDLFGTDPKPTAPATATPIDDLFGTDPKPTEPANATPIDDLFGSDPKPAAPETADPIEPKPSEGIEDIFKTNDKPVADPSIDDLFGKPITTDVDLSNGESKKLPIDEDDAFIDSLFGKSTGTSAAKEPVQDAIDKPSSLPENAKPRSEKSPGDELDALFGVGALKPATEFKGAEYRLWADNSGAYQVNARLSVIYVDKIKLLKDNGKFTTVPLSRLSDADFGYVSWVASNLTGEHTARMVKTDSRGVESDVSR